MKSDFFIALTQLASERHLPKEQVLEAIEMALASAFKKDYPDSADNISVTLDPNSGDINVYSLKTVVEEVSDPSIEIQLTDAVKLQPGLSVGDEFKTSEPLSHNASRIAAQTAKQVVLQRLREAERERLYEEFYQHKDTVMSGVVEQVDPGKAVIIELGRAQAVMPGDEQVYVERYRKGQRTKVFVVDVRNSAKGPAIIVSRSHPDLLKRLFEIEVPEINGGVVTIQAVAREAGSRSKIAVSTTQDGIDPVGSCIGVRGNRIQSIVNELQGEKIDVVQWDSDPKVFISRSISPSEVLHVELAQGEPTATVVVPDKQLSLAIGKDGQNARLAARLTGWRLDIKGHAEWEVIRKEMEEAMALQKAAEPEIPEEVPVVAEAVSEALDDSSNATILEEKIEETVIATTDEPPISKEDEDAILEALILEEEQSETVSEQLDESLSIDELDEFTIEDLEEMDDINNGNLEFPQLGQNAGLIRFAEDIVEENERTGSSRRRGSGRSNNQRRSKGSAR
ncbi:MAG: transcription termination factor NusA [Dehalococcoidia bacterium]|tara:strand:+ start:13130 stop:14659 length:1530 start_codon:yes stop_codon:yes gene_type:complete